LDSERADYYSDLADILIWMDRYEEALEAIERAIELNPKKADHYSTLAEILIWINRFGEGLEAINKAIELDQKRIKFYIQKASYLAYDFNEYESALRILGKAFELNPEESSLFELYEHQAGILLSMKNHESALKVIEKARQLFPSKEIFPNLQ